ncbi:DUF2577 domain-containing protein [Clostridium botulinum]|nr:DUF2577 domain-containing protein [Clostridium botulinum]MCS4472359.1 DUF2577 domain-containing protein [Clostridium botulinum]MCS4474861.1 DUF2577 domain-containing protein [Clostridium botulinum]MCS4480684.1 DUF2577 domain-containing protein [Clostridium botulinum]MCS4482756.1 DUF2577 domain-containing protein [Clostridium botulinum]
MDNPYLTILQIMKKQGVQETPSITLGKAINSTTIQVGDLQLTKDNLLINKDITLSSEDTVAVYPINNGQIYIVLCKVV